MFGIKKNGLKEDLLVVGVGRSGTTWLGELLNGDNQYKVIFEPFSPTHNPKWRKVGKQRLYFGRHDSFKYKNLMYKILSGKVDCNWSDVDELGDPNSSKTMVKEIRVNLMLGWIQQNFPELKIIYIVRDPYSVALSSAERKWYATMPAHYLSQESLVRDHLSKEQVELFKKAGSLFQNSMVVWTLENYLALKCINRNNNVTSVFYETLAKQPITEIQRLATFCGREQYELEETAIGKKSKHAGNNSVVDIKSQRFGRRWEGRITKEDEAYAEEILKSFSLDKLYKERNVPAYDQPLDLVL